MTDRYKKTDMREVVSKRTKKVQTYFMDGPYTICLLCLSLQCYKSVDFAIIYPKLRLYKVEAGTFCTVAKTRAYGKTLGLIDNNI